MRAALQELLATLRLQGMGQALEAILAKAEAEALSVAEAPHLLLLEEQRHRQERSLAYRLEQAKLPWDWSLETFPFAQQPGVNAAQSPPGTGKSGLAIGLLRAALINDYRGRFYKAQELFDEL